MKKDKTLEQLEASAARAWLAARTAWVAAEKAAAVARTASGKEHGKQQEGEEMKKEKASNTWRGLRLFY